MRSTRADIHDGPERNTLIRAGYRCKTAHRQLDEVLLQRTAGPYIRGHKQTWPFQFLRSPYPRKTDMDQSAFQRAGDEDRKWSLLSKAFSLLCRETFPVVGYREFRRNYRFQNQFEQRVVPRTPLFAEFPCTFPC